MVIWGALSSSEAEEMDCFGGEDWYLKLGKRWSQYQLKSESREEHRQLVNAYCLDKNHNGRPCSTYTCQTQNYCGHLYMMT